MDLHDILKHNRDTYDLIASTYKQTLDDEISKKNFDRNLLDRVTNSLQKNDGLILDIGTGAAGHIGRYLFDKGFQVCGIDLSPTSISLAQKTNPDMQFKVMNMLNLKFEDSSIQAIIAFYSIIHIPKNEINNLFKEFFRVLQPHGLLVLAVHEGDTEYLADEILGYKTTFFVNFFREQELITNLSQNSFIVSFCHTRAPYEFEHQTNRIYDIGQALK